MLKIKFQNNYYYHIYNRGVDKRNIFMEEQKTAISAPSAVAALGADIADIEILKKLPKLVEIICYCLIPNHYHLILKQLVDNGISMFMHKLADSYSHYFNKKYDRLGSLFQGTYQAIHINTDSYLLWLSGYVNGNIEIHKIAKAEKWPWSSYLDYLGKRNGTLYNKKVILDQFQDIKEYKNLVNIIIKESSQRKDDIKRYLLE
ncbi:MAG: transposase [Patescibacteria group bacterium]|nr:transposase [Patescibacteria group bacterium]